MNRNRFAVVLLVFLSLMPTAFAAHPKDRPRDPKAVYIYHTYVSDNRIDKKGETINAYTLVKGGDGPIEIRADLMRHDKVMRSWDWQSDPNITVSAELPDLTNGTYYMRVSARDGKTEWTENSVRIYINRPDLNAVPVANRTALGTPIRYNIYMCGIRDTSNLFIKVVSALTGDIVREDQITYDAITGKEYHFVPRDPGVYYLEIEARPTYKTSYFTVSGAVSVLRETAQRLPAAGEYQYRAN
ncbi:MAG: hypothetical protein PHQ85_05270 [Eubacteriales bacterium]|nr:hypothetical protein [Eubacteriales bacterium]MDD4105776.1 hypothetical protein [Eubacteriales bacterium]MDD4710754.1 hypothetical protein [Eubacteriales bacterium]NLO14579.1 hypothetical protein [Clostridiales bacterium]